MHVVEHREGRLGEPSRGIESPCEESSLKTKNESMKQTPRQRGNRTRDEKLMRQTVGVEKCRTIKLRSP